MASSNDIDLQESGPLTNLEVERVREICGLKSFVQTSDLCTPLIDVQRQATRSDIKAFDKVKDGAVGLDGGRDGVKFSQLDNKEEIRRRLRLRLGLDAVDLTQGDNVAYMVNYGVEPIYDRCDEAEY